LPSPKGGKRRTPLCGGAVLGVGGGCEINNHFFETFVIFKRNSEQWKMYNG